MAENIEKLALKVLSLSKNKEEYKKKVLERHYLHDELKKMFVSEIYDRRNTPRLEIYVNHDSFIDNKLEIRYQTRIIISKLVDALKLSFHCTVLNPDPRKHERRIEAESLFECYINEQVTVEKKIVSLCEKYNIKKITYREEHLVLPDLDFVHSGMKFFGSQPTVGMLLFEDFFDYFSDAEPNPS